MLRKKWYRVYQVSEALWGVGQLCWHLGCTLYTCGVKVHIRQSFLWCSANKVHNVAVHLFIPSYASEIRLLQSKSGGVEE